VRADDLLRLPAAEGARRVVLRLLAEARSTSRRLADAGDAEALHDFRVALRRLRSTLRAWRPLLGRPVRGRLRRRLRALADATGAARDAEVQLASVRALAAHSGQPGGRGAAWLAARAEGVLAGGHADARREARRRFRRLEPKLRRALFRETAGENGGPAFAQAAAVLMREQADGLAAALARVRSRSHEVAAHRARIEAKRLRYLLEPLQGSRCAEVAEALEALKGLQDLLGEMHDLHLLAPALAAAARRDAASPVRRSLDPLEAARRDRLGALFAAFSKEWRPRGAARHLARLRHLAHRLAAGAPDGPDARAPGGRRRSRRRARGARGRPPQSSAGPQAGPPTPLARPGRRGDVAP
jgi:CHAD domain-containing protein